MGGDNLKTYSFVSFFSISSSTANTVWKGDTSLVAVQLLRLTEAIPSNCRVLIYGTGVAKKNLRSADDNL
jgi:hypothetical protein